MIVDTPGQIEVFNWSASGSIITEGFSLSFPTIVLYVVDTPKCICPTTFMSNMLYACRYLSFDCSILYKTKLPFLLLFNKIDLTDCQFAIEWMKDFEVFHQAIQEDDSNFMSSLVTSMSLVLEEFYSTLSVTGVSAVTGEGKEEFFKHVLEAEEEYKR